MIVQLFSADIAKQWDAISVAIDRSLPPIADGEERLKNIFEALTTEKMQCWAALKARGEGEPPQLLGYSLTMVTEDAASRVKSLLVYCLYTLVTQFDNEHWIEAFNAIKKFGKAKGCTRIIGFTDSERIKWLVKGVLNGNADYTFVSIPI